MYKLVSFSEWEDVSFDDAPFSVRHENAHRYPIRCAKLDWNKTNSTPLRKMKESLSESHLSFNPTIFAWTDHHNELYSDVIIVCPDSYILCAYAKFSNELLNAPQLLEWGAEAQIRHWLERRYPQIVGETLLSN